MPNPLTDELTDDTKAELAAVFAALKREYPPMQDGNCVRMVPVFMPKTWQRRGW